MDLETVWTGDLKHKGKLVTRVNTYSCYRMPSFIKDNFDIGQRVTFKEFQRKILSIRDNGFRLTFTTQTKLEDYYVLPIVFKPRQISKNWLTFTSYLTKLHSVGVSTFKENDSALFMIPCSFVSGAFPDVPIHLTIDSSTPWMYGLLKVPVNSSKPLMLVSSVASTSNWQLNVIAGRSSDRTGCTEDEGALPEGRGPNLFSHLKNEVWQTEFDELQKSVMNLDDSKGDAKNKCLELLETITYTLNTEHSEDMTTMTFNGDLLSPVKREGHGSHTSIPFLTDTHGDVDISEIADPAEREEYIRQIVDKMLQDKLAELSTFHSPEGLPMQIVDGADVPSGSNQVNLYNDKTDVEGLVIAKKETAIQGEQGELFYSNSFAYNVDNMETNVSLDAGERRAASKRPILISYESECDDDDVRRDQYDESCHTTDSGEKPSKDHRRRSKKTDKKQKLKRRRSDGEKKKNSSHKKGDGKSKRKRRNASSSSSSSTSRCSERTGRSSKIESKTPTSQETLMETVLKGMLAGPALTTGLLSEQVMKQYIAKIVEDNLLKMSQKISDIRPPDQPAAMSSLEQVFRMQMLSLMNPAALGMLPHPFLATQATIPVTENTTEDVQQIKHKKPPKKKVFPYERSVEFNHASIEHLRIMASKVSQTDREPTEWHSAVVDCLGSIKDWKSSLEETILKADNIAQGSSGANSDLRDSWAMFHGLKSDLRRLNSFEALFDFFDHRILYEKTSKQKNAEKKEVEKEKELDALEVSLSMLKKAKASEETKTNKKGPLKKDLQEMLTKAICTCETILLANRPGYAVMDTISRTSRPKGYRFESYIGPALKERRRSPVYKDSETGRTFGNSKFTARGRGQGRPRGRGFNTDRARGGFSDRSSRFSRVWSTHSREVDDRSTQSSGRFSRSRDARESRDDRSQRSLGISRPPTPPMRRRKRSLESRTPPPVDAKMRRQVYRTFTPSSPPPPASGNRRPMVNVTPDRKQRRLRSRSSSNSRNFGIIRLRNERIPGPNGSTGSRGNGSPNRVRSPRSRSRSRQRFQARSSRSRSKSRQRLQRPPSVSRRQSRSASRH